MYCAGAACYAELTTRDRAIKAPRGCPIRGVADVTIEENSAE